MGSNVVTMPNASTNASILGEVTRDFQAHVAEQLQPLAKKIRETEGKGEITFKISLAYNPKDEQITLTTSGDFKHPRAKFTESLCEISSDGQISLF